MGFDVIPALSNGLTTIKTAFQSDGPAAGLTAIGSGIKDAVGAAMGGLGSLGDSIANLFSGTGAKPFDKKLPLPNILNDYATYNYVISLGVLSDQEVNYPDSTYKAGKVPKLILKSGNANPDNRVATAYGKFDFFIDNLSINSQIGFDRSTANTNATTFDFQVTEPYSMGLFMIACQQAAFDVGYPNFREAAFILMIEFRGNTQTGIPQKVPGTTKYLPFRFTNISMKVTGKGSVYQVSALPYNEQAFSKQVSNLKTDAAVKGKTVQELLQTGPESLQVVINKHYQELVEKKIVEVADQILILFPKAVASDGTGSAASSDQENNTPATQDNSNTSDPNSDLFKKLGVSISSKNKTLVQAEGECNAIGGSKMGYGLTRKPITPTAKTDQVTSDKNNVEVRGKMTIDPELSEFKFSQDTNIPNAINQVILQSSFVDKAIDPSQLTPQGYFKWWRIESQTYVINSNANMSSTGTKPKLYVYRVVPYAAHASKVMPPNSAAPGFAQLKQEVVKEYNYIYTGKNQEIINFSIDIANGFQQMMLADNANKSQDTKTQDKDAAGSDPKSGIGAVKGNTPPKPGTSIPTQTSYAKVGTSSDNKGGGGAETNSTRVAKLFHDALITGKDLVNLDLEIMGDPYYLTSSGMGNYTARPSSKMNINGDDEMNYHNGEVDIVVNFRTPIDVNQATGLYDFGKSVAVQQFSGLYKVTTLVSTFAKGKFTQKLSGYRRQGQDDFRTASPSSVPSAQPKVQVPDNDLASVPVSTPGLQTFDDGSSIQTFDDGSTLVTDTDGKITSTPAPE